MDKAYSGSPIDALDFEPIFLSTGILVLGGFLVGPGCPH
jgi:hypothetical protein